MASGDSTTRGEPELRVERKRGIPRGEVQKKGFVRVSGCAELLDHNGVAFKGTVTLVGG